MKILGISAFYHDSSVALIDDEKLYLPLKRSVFQEKTIKNFKKSLKFLVLNYLIMILKIYYIVFFDKPFLKFERLLETYLYYSPLKDMICLNNLYQFGSRKIISKRFNY